MSDASVNGIGSLGSLRVVTTNNGGHTAETLADLCTDKLMHVSPTAPEPVRLQAEAFKNTMREIIRGYLVQAKQSERTTIVTKLRKHGFDDAANIIGAL